MAMICIACIIATVATDAKSKCTSSCILVTADDFQDNHCDALMRVSLWAGALSLPSSSLLFFLRIKGIYHDSRAVLVTFFILWLSTWSILLVPLIYKFIIEKSQDGSFAWCWVSDPSRLSFISFIAVTIFDTAVLAAITIRVTANAQAKTMSDRASSIIFANNLGQVGRSLLRSGQFYYM